jgi:hypothetical protein
VDAAPVIARGHNVAVLLPPAPAAALPYLQAIPADRRALVVTADADGAVALADGAALAPALAVSGLARARRRLAAGLPRFLCVSAGDALRLLERSALPAAEFQTLVLAWPEQLDPAGLDALETVMGEMAKDAQRMILVAVADPAIDALIERYAFKAVTFGFPPAAAAEAPAPAPLGAAGYVVARAAQLEQVRRRVFDALDPERDDALLVEPCPVSREAAAALASRAAGARLILVVEPAQLPWLRGVFAPLSAVRLPTALDALEERAEAVRARLARSAEHDDLDRELFLLGPLLDRFDPALLAAAALRLAAPLAQAPELLAAGGGAGGDATAPGDRPAAGLPSWVRLWIGVGRKDNVRPGDVLGAIVGETRIAADRVGKIDVRELYALVEVRSEEAERVVRALTGTVLKGRRLTARVDRGGGGGGHAPGGSGSRPGRSLA